MQPSLRDKCHIIVDRLLAPVQSQTIGSVNRILIHPKVLPLAAQRLSITEFLALINVSASWCKYLKCLAKVYLSHTPDTHPARLLIQQAPRVA